MSGITAVADPEDHSKDIFTGTVQLRGEIFEVPVKALAVNEAKDRLDDLFPVGLILTIKFGKK